MKLKEVVVRKGYMNRDTIKGRSGSYRSVENSAEVTLTYTIDESENESEALQRANDTVRDRAKDLLDDDPSWLKQKEENEGRTNS